MKRFFALTLGILLSASSTYPVDNVRNKNLLPTIVDAIETVMHTSDEQSLNIDTLLNSQTNSIDSCDEKGWNLLSVAMYKRFDSLSQQLEAHGARLGWSIAHAIKHDNETALRPLLNAAQQREHNHSIDIILFAGGVTPLAYALIQHSPRSVALLKEFNASLEKAYSACIHHRNSVVFNNLYQSVNGKESLTALGNLVYTSLFQPNATLLTNIRLTAGSQMTLDLLKYVEERHPELATSSKNYALAFKTIALALAVENDSPAELVQALRVNKANVDPRDILKDALERNAQNIVRRLTTVDKPFFIPLSKVARVIHRNNQKLVVDYIITYMAQHDADESLQSIKALYLAAAQKQLHDVTHECQKWLAEKAMSLTLETDNLELLKTALDELEAEQIHLELDVILGRALGKNARAITTWLCQEKHERIDLNYAIELMDRTNSESAQIYLTNYIQHLQTVPMEEYGIALFILENQLGQKVQELNIPSLTLWHAQTMLPLITDHIEAVQDAAETVNKDQGHHASKR